MWSLTHEWEWEAPSETSQMEAEDLIQAKPGAAWKPQPFPLMHWENIQLSLAEQDKQCSHDKHQIQGCPFPTWNSSFKRCF